MRLLSLAVTLITILFVAGCKNEVASPPPLGPEWRVYTTADSPIGSNRIRCMTLDFDGSIWIGTDAGLLHFIPKSNSWTNFKDTLRKSVTSLAQAKDRSIWIGTSGGGVYRFNPQSQTGQVWTNFTSQVPATVSGIAAYRTDPIGYGEIWVSSSAGLDRYKQTGPDEGNWDTFLPMDFANTPTNFMTSAYLNPINDHLWFGAAIGGAVEAYYDINLLWGRYESPVEQYQVNSVAVDLGDNVWFGKEVGASRLNLTTNQWTYFTSDSTNGQFPGGAVKAIVTNYHTTRWFGMDSGLVLLEDTTYTRFTQDNSGLPNNRVSSLALDLRGNLWIGTQFGLAVYKKGGTQF